MSGFNSPYEEDNPFADMPAGSMPVAAMQSPTLDDPLAALADEQEPTTTSPAHEAEATAATASASSLSARSDNIPQEPRQQSLKAIGAVTESVTASPERKFPSGTMRKSRKQPVRAAAISSRFSSLSLDEADPLGPLGAVRETDSTPAEPDERAAETPTMQQTPVRASHAQETPGSQGRAPPSMPLSEAANPTFHIHVGDPVKIGDLTSAHTVYKVTTRTTSKAFKNPECSVTRRYRDFLWLYEQLGRTCPGAIIPPPPEKQAMGRFSENFVEARRYALERMLDKIGKHPILRGEADFKLFLESETFANDVKHRPVDARIAHEQSRGFLGLGGAFSMPGKFIESEEFFEQKKQQFDLLDGQLKHLSRAVDVVIKQRRDLAHTTSEFGAALSALSTVELSRSLSNALGSLSDLQIKIQELHDRQAQQDLLTLGHTVEEYQRLIGSVKAALLSRQKAWFAWQEADTEAAKRRSASDKIKRQAKTQQDRLNQVDAEFSEAERKAHTLKLAFTQIGKVLKSELQRFEMDKVEDFKTSLEMFLESAVEAQKEVIEHWEFYHDLLIQELEEDLVPDQAASKASSAVKAQAHPEASAIQENPSPSNNHSAQAQASQDNPVDEASSEDHAGAAETFEEESAVQSQAGTEPPTPSTGGLSSQLAASPGDAPIPADEANPFARPNTADQS